MEADSRRLAGLETELQKNTEALHLAEDRIKAYEAELEELGDSDLDSASDRLRNAQTEKADARVEMTQLDGEIEQCRDQIRASEYVLKEIENQQFLRLLLFQNMMRS